MAEIINFTWCENNGFEKPGMNVAYQQKTVHGMLWFIQNQQWA